MTKTQWPADNIERRKVAELVPYARNSRTHSAEQVAQIAASIKEWGWTVPVLIEPDGGIIAGHGRIMAAQQLGIEEVPCMVAEGWSEGQKRAYIIADNKLTLNAGWDDEMLRVELAELGDLDFDLSLTGFNDLELEAFAPSELPGEGDDASTESLADRFGIPPFSVLNAREGWWQSRRGAWVGLGIESELGRDAESYSLNGDAVKRYDYLPDIKSGTSIFDPVLCEMAYSWFSPKGGTVLDPFAGGSVRGIVASRLGRQYIGVELRDEQVAANRAQGDDLCHDLPPVWHTGDSRNIDRICADVGADFVFSCPPYADLEIYSDDPNDLSTMDYGEFKEAYFDIIAKSCALLKYDRFACFVVGDVRDKKGNYYNFVGDTVEAFQEAGMHYYNEAILVTAVGSLPIRAGRQFKAGRKLGKTHQNVLVFVKGDGKRAAQACGDVEVHIPEASETDG